MISNYVEEAIFPCVGQFEIIECWCLLLERKEERWNKIKKPCDFPLSDAANFMRSQTHSVKLSLIRCRVVEQILIVLEMKVLHVRLGIL